MGLAPFFHEIESMPGDYFEEYAPNVLETRYQQLMHRQISESLQERRKYEYQWEFATRRFNLLADEIKDERLSNTLMPVLRMIVMGRLSRLTKGEMDITYVPGYDDSDLVDVWGDCRRHVNSKCNYNYEMQRAYLCMSLFGNAPLYDGYRASYMTQRIPDGKGQFKETVFRDPKESKIFTESIMPWQYLVHPGGKDIHDAPSHTYTRYMHYDAWVAEFARVPKSSGKPLYMHTKAVRPGYAWKYDQGQAKWVSFQLQHQMVCVNYHWIPTMDLHLIESNGVLNWCGPNPYLHKRAPFNMLRLHPQMDSGGLQIAKYWQGDPWMLSGLDTLFQNTMNMWVDNFYFSQSSVIGVPTGVNIDVDDEEFYGGTIIRGADKMIVNQLAKVDGQSYQFAWKVLNDMLISASSVPFNQLVPEGQITAYELSKRIDLANEGMASVMRVNENYGLKGSEEQKISNIFQFLPREDFYAITDPDSVDRLIKEGKIAQNDVVYEDGLPVMVRSFPMIETKNRVIKEKFVNNFPVPELAEVVETGRSGRLAARPENIQPTEWLRNNGTPEVYIDSSTMFGRHEDLERQQFMEESANALAQNDRKRQRKEPDAFNEDEIFEEMVRVMKRNPRKWLKKHSDTGTRINRNVDTREIEQKMRDEISAQALGDSGPAQPPEVTDPNAAPSPTSVGAPRPQTEGSLIQSKSQQLNKAMTPQ